MLLFNTLLSHITNHSYFEEDCGCGDFIPIQLQLITEKTVSIASSQSIIVVHDTEGTTQTIQQSLHKKYSPTSTATVYSIDG